MEVLEQRRRAARAWVTREANRLKIALEKEDSSDIDIKKGLKDLEVRLGRLDTVQCEIESTIHENDLDKDIENADNFLQNSREVMRLVEQRLASCTHLHGAASREQVSSGDAPIHRGDNGGRINAHLPKIEIPKFSGHYSDWTEFWDKFVAIVDSSSIPTISKFSYLQSLLTGEAYATIKGLSLTETNYGTAMSLLKDRYGRKERIILTHIQRLLNIDIPNVRVVSKLWQVYNDLQSNIRSLENLGIDGQQYGVVLTPMVLSRLPQEFRLEWARLGEGREGDLDWLLDFLKNEISRRERSETYQKPPNEQRRDSRVPSAAVLQTKGTVRHFSACSFCGKGHPSQRCWNLKKLSIDEVKAILKDKNLCFRCFESSHVARNCSVICSTCSGRHNNLFCNRNNVSKARAESVDRPHTDTKTECGSVSEKDPFARTDGVHYHSSRFTNQTTVMQTLKVTVNNMPCMMLFDSGSDKSYVTSSFVKKVRPKYVGNESVSHVCFGEKGPRHPTKRNLFEISGLMSNGINKSITVTEIPMITAPMFRSKIPECLLDEFHMIGPVSLKQRFIKSENVCVDVLIGLDYYWQLMTSNVIRSSHGLVAQESVFGWILSGSYQSFGNDKGIHKSDLHHQNLCLTDVSDTLVRSFWELESLGIKNIEERADKTLETFNKTVRFLDDRYEVELPWKDDKRSLLQNNLEQAKQRLGSLERKLDRDPDLKARYNAALADLENDGIFEEVPPDQVGIKEHPIFYLPHRPVVKESSMSTKVRPVFDASAIDRNGVSLNSCMNTGPYLTGNLLDVLLRFRRWKYALSGDITKAFFHIQVNSVDRDVHRFLWKQHDDVRIMRLTRVPFGNTASPFLLNATLKFHLAQQPSSRVVEELLSNMYVDDWLTGADTVNEVKELMSNATAIMNKASMPLTKWCSNDAVVADQDIQILKEKAVDVEQHKVLGILWIPTKDCFSFTEMDFCSNHLIITRRIVLSCISKIFDPIGFLQPFVMVAKIIFQSLWKAGLQWDEQVPKEEGDRFLAWMSQLSRISDFCVPRSFVKLSWEKKKALQLHAFGDASERGYGSCVYVKVWEEDGSVTSSLVMAKAKLAPVKKVTLPRLELLGALLSARLLTYVKKALLLPESTSYKCWTDSTVTLQWIQSDAARWKTFVQNRVSEIQELTSPDSWGHCPGTENPADILSRGLMLDSLLSSEMWLKGPAWMGTDFEFNTSHTVEGESTCNSDSSNEERVDCSVQLKVETKIDPVFPVERWGDFSKAIRICALILRFVNNLKATRSHAPRNTGKLNTNELDLAYTELLRQTQYQYFGAEFSDLKVGKCVNRSSSLFKMRPFIDEEGLLRMKGRLHFSNLSFDEKHPVILQKCHISLLLVRREHKILHHAGVTQVIASLRNKFWIINLRSIVKQVKRQCVTCSRHDARLPCQEASPIPRSRIVKSNPFSVIGVDYAGPLFTADFVGKKFYILLFTCAVIRAVHLELVDSLSLPDFLLAFRRFTARRGMPSIIISDNAKTFKAASVSLVREFTDQSPKWQFITPRAPWFGGFWERLIKSTKLCLRKTLGLKSQTRSELETTLHQVEACINSRPLTMVHDTIDDVEPLTPSHFLLGRSGCHRPVSEITLPSLDITGQDLRQLLLTKNVHLHRFWSVWQREYIRNLPLMKHPVGNKEVVEGTLCLIKEDNLPRTHWPLGKIIQTFPGKDSVTRTVKVKTPKGHLTRPLNKICCLEVLENREDNMVIPDNHEGNSEAPGEIREAVGAGDGIDVNRPYTTRAGRVVKPKKRCD